MNEAPSSLAANPTGAAAIALAGLAALAVAMGVGRFAFTPILPMMQAGQGVSVGQGGWLAAANYLGYLAGALAAMRGGSASRAIRGGLVAVALTTIAMGFVESFAAWAVLRFASGVASALVLVSVSAWSLARLAELGRPASGGTVFAGVGIGIAAAGLACLALGGAGAGPAQAWIVLGAASLAIAIALWPLFASHASPSTAAPGAPPAAPASPFAWKLLLCYGAFGFGYIVPATFLPAMARRALDDPSLYGWSWPVFGLAAMASTFAAAAVRQRLGDRRTWIAAHGLMAAGVALPLAWPGLAGLVVSALLVGGTFMVATMAGMQEARRLGGAHAPRLMAAMTAAFATGQIAGPVLVALLDKRADAFALPLASAALMLLASAAWLALPDSPPRTPT